MKKLILLALVALSAVSYAQNDLYALQIPCQDPSNHEAAYECLNPDVAVSKYVGQHVQVVKYEMYVDDDKWPLYSVAYYIRRDY